MDAEKVRRVKLLLESPAEAQKFLANCFKTTLDVMRFNWHDVRLGDGTGESIEALRAFNRFNDDAEVFALYCDLRAPHPIDPTPIFRLKNKMFRHGVIGESDDAYKRELNALAGDVYILMERAEMLSSYACRDQKPAPKQKITPKQLAKLMEYDDQKSANKFLKEKCGITPDSEICLNRGRVKGRTSAQYDYAAIRKVVRDVAGRWLPERLPEMASDD